MATGNAASHYAQLKILAALLTNTAFTPPATVYLALFTVTPTDNGGGTEVTTSGTAYVRQAASFAAPVSGGSSAGSTCATNATINFPVATANYGTVVGWALFDASSGGNMITFGTWSASQAVLTSNQYTVPSGSLVISSY